MRMRQIDHTRRDFLKTLGICALASAVPACWGIPVITGKNAKNKPNVLFIAIDDMNDWIGCLGGHPGVKTPNLDKLAQRGVLFTKAYASAPLCNPSRASLMTGIRPSTSGVYDNRQPWRRSPVLEDAITLPQYFMANGYRVVGGGKIYHHAKDCFDPKSWQDYFPDQSKYPGKCMPDHPKHPDFSPGHPVPDGASFSFGPLDIADEKMSDWKVTSWAIKELSKKHNKPFFLGCGIFRPHLAWFVPKKYFDMYPPEKVTLPIINEDDLDDVPPIGKSWAKPNGDHRKITENHLWRRAVQAYLACVSFADACVGRVIDALDKSPYADNTIIVLWSDHGWHLGEKLHWRKFALWEEAAHNVLMIIAPGITKPGSLCKRTVSLLDIYPTLVEICGLESRKELEGVSLLPLLKNPEVQWQCPALTTYLRNNHSVRSERWRYIRYSDGNEELYDHDNDDLEWNNLAKDLRYFNVKKELSKWLPNFNATDAPRRIKRK